MTQWIEGHILVRLDPAPARLAQTLHLFCASGTEVAEERGPTPELRLTLPLAEDGAICRAAALTQGGATLLRGRVELTLVGETVEGGGGPAAPPPGDSIDIGWVIAGVAIGVVALGAAIAGTAVALTSGSDQAILGAPQVVG